MHEAPRVLTPKYSLLIFPPSSSSLFLSSPPNTQLNINVERAVAVPGSLMTMGNTGIDPTGNPYLILAWLDDRYTDHGGGIDYSPGRSRATQGRPANASTPEPSLIPMVAGFRAMQPSVDGGQGEQPAQVYMQDYDQEPGYRVNVNLSSDPTTGPFGISEYTYRTDLIDVKNFTAKKQFPQPVLFMMSKYQHSKAVETNASNILRLPTSAQNSVLNAVDYGVLGSNYVCTVRPNSTTDPVTHIIVPLAEFSCQACLRMYQAKVRLHAQQGIWMG